MFWMSMTRCFLKVRPPSKLTLLFFDHERTWDELRDQGALKPALLEDWARMVQRWVPAVLANFPGDEAKLREQIEGLLHASYSLSAEGVSHDLTTGYAFKQKGPVRSMGHAEDCFAL